MLWINEHRAQMMTDSADEVLEQVRKVLGAESRLDMHRYPLRTAFDRGVLSLEGEVNDISVNKLVLKPTADADQFEDTTGISNMFLT
jgi:hypothetical protein